ncbi:39S ribosomal protein L37, mitochondrial-like [Haliotis rubra]|uniref:39S ribosomal protein L37, mitochondrial-like n=1 Tax=Haliotis rubra TaxID=36100 RepID=UPI001EE627CB|nr:39S ribosomal protein L37, mitochondrial-like [Haliotis rubra]
MRLTNELCRRNLVRMWKKAWKKYGSFTEYPVNISRERLNQGIEIVDPVKGQELSKVTWTPPVADDPRFWRPMPMEEQSNYHDEPTHLVTPKTRLLKGVQQASILAKAQPIKGFPSNVENLVGAVEIPNQDNLVQRYIMQSQVWDPTKDKLPKRIDTRKVGWHFQAAYGIKNEKSSTILLQNMIRLCQSLAGTYPCIATDRRLLYKPYVGTHYFHDDNMVSVQGLYEYLISGQKGLNPFASEDEVDATAVEPLADISPISPLIDLSPTNCYSLDTVTHLNKPHSHGIPQTLFMLNKNYWNTDQRQARCLLFCLATALSQARKLYGIDVKQLPEPVSVQCVNMDPTTVNFIFFQLNTADFKSRDGIKNMAWFSGDHHLFKKELSQPWLGKEYENTKYIDYEADVFRRFLAVFLNGLPDIHSNEIESDVSAAQS